MEAIRVEILFNSGTNSVYVLGLADDSVCEDVGE